MNACWCILGETAACRNCPNNRDNSPTVSYITYTTTLSTSITKYEPIIESRNYSYRTEYCSVCGKPIKYPNEIVSEKDKEYCSCHKELENVMIKIIREVGIDAVNTFKEKK